MTGGGPEEPIASFSAPGVADVSRGTSDPDLERGDPGSLDPLKLLAEIAEPIVLDDVIVPHRFRPGWSVRYSIALDSDDLKRWRKSATRKPGTSKEEVDEIRLACIVLANLGRVLIRQGVELYDDEGKALSFAHPEVWNRYNAARAADCVRSFYGNDPYLVATLDAVLAAAGVGEEVETLDPTQRSSD